MNPGPYPCKLLSKTLWKISHKFKLLVDWLQIKETLLFL